MIEIKKDPSRSELRWFGLLLAIFFGLIGGLVYWRTELTTLAYSLWGAGVALAVIYYVIPPLRKPMFLGWMYAAFPIGWIISHIILAITYYLVLTPIGLIMRACGRDPMHRKLDPEASTYWIARSPTTDARRYFRQF